MLPALDGAVVATVNAAVPLAAFAARPLDIVTVHVTSAPAEFKGEHFTALTPTPVPAAVAAMPAGTRRPTSASRSRWKT